ncbi:MAG: hypothetical protein PHD29_06470 [bacterium]|nr:hypothetical protein [bacterium]
MEISINDYTVQSRFMPVLIVFVPIGILIWACMMGAYNLLVSTLSGSMVIVIISAGLSQIGRDLGKRKEPSLFKMWGGAPTTQMLTSGKSILNEETIKRYHAKLRTLTNTKDTNIQGADQTALLETYILFLRENTRDARKYPLVNKENINYGFRRNLWAMKPSAIAITIISVILLFAYFIFSLDAGNINDRAIIAIIFNISILVLWTFRINPEWVRLAAVAYAERLIASCELM